MTVSQQPIKADLVAPAGFDALAGIATPILFIESDHPGLIERVLLNTAAAQQFLGHAAPGRWVRAEPANLRRIGLDPLPWLTWDWGDAATSATVDHRIGPAERESWWRLSLSRVRVAAPLRLLVSASRIDDLYHEHNLPDAISAAVVEEIEALAGFGHYAFWPQRREGLWSRGMARIWSVPEAQSEREFENMLALIHPTDLEQRRARDERGSVTQETEEVRIVRADGEVRNIRSIAAHHVDGEGRVQQVTRIDQDVTELRRAEEELRLAREAAGDAARAKEAFLHLMNHSLRTPLNAILGFGEAMRDQIYGPLSADYAQSIDAVNDSAQRLLELVDDILDLTRLESGRYSLSKSVCDLDRIIAETIELVSPRVTERNLRLVAAAPSGDPVTVWGEERGVRQILVNLLEFATVSARDEHTITIAARHGDDGSALLCLEDDGAGLRREITNAILDPLGSGLNASEARGASSWFGLSLVKSFLQLHSGRLDAEAMPDGRFRIDVRLPR